MTPGVLSEMGDYHLLIRKKKLKKEGFRSEAWLEIKSSEVHVVAYV